MTDAKTEPGEDGYQGSAALLLDGQDGQDGSADSVELAIEVTLRGHFQPIDGRYRWYGRVNQDAELDRLVGGRRCAATLRTPHGQAAGELSDPDTWGRYRIMGTGRPPFPVPTSLADLPAEVQG
ncbi:MAG TPA: DUF4873 domain-containing protein [Pseudonocardiaceae bacterium]|jgi:hypothetical protein|nr:DUF4873 domain-containing protein [Pseudonocardiaceae bacterium]